jgi:eukaryotic-like serine/threonine-protein kinase
MPDPLPTDPRCPECGAVIPDAALEGMCPMCLMNGLWEGESSHRTDTLLGIRGYDVVKEIGRGGMGVVYLARQHDPQREIALKMLLPVHGVSAEMRERFRQEAATVSALDHPHILPMYAVGEHDGLPWFTLKLASGGTLAQRIGAFRRRWRDIATLLATLAEATHYAHQRGVLHRDMKPGNVIFDEADWPYLSDFGLAKWIDDSRSGRSSLTLMDSAMGTPHYLSPEAATRGATAATASSDVYGLGAILYELLAGHLPITAETTPELMRRICDDQPQRLPTEVPIDLASVAMKCLEKEPHRRYESASALASDLRSWLDGHGVRARPANAAVRLGRWTRRNPALALMAMALILAIATGVVMQIRANGQLREALTISLINQAKLTAQGTERGARSGALAILQQADAQGATLSPELIASRRTEIIQALGRPDLAPAVEWPLASASSEGGESFSPDFTQYLASTPDGGFALFDTASRTALRSWPPLDDEREARKKAVKRWQP